MPEPWTYQIREGGLMRCCLASLDAQMKERLDDGQGPPQEGDKLKTTCCGTDLIFTDDVWQWDQ